jgi:divinyl chlorophyllide a 8-vinyl-reductase
MKSSVSNPSSKRVVVVGATGYIGKYVVKESVRRGYETVAFVRPGSQKRDDYFAGAQIIEGDVCDEKSVRDLAFGKETDVVISCLASRSGIKSDSYKIDYQATLNCLNAARDAKVGHFILLSAFCVKKPLLQFQKAKLKFEEALTSAGDIRYSIVRPTAFFKSVSGQLELLQQGWPFVMFGDGKICQCNPIAENDLASYMLNCVDEEDKWNQILDLGGPDRGMTMAEQGDMIFDILDKKPSFIKAPIGIFDAIISALAWFGQFNEKAEDAAELARIGKYYAVEDMLTTEPSQMFGTITLRQHYERIAVEGQEYDPYTTMLAAKKPPAQ